MKSSTRENILFDPHEVREMMKTHKIGIQS